MSRHDVTRPDGSILTIGWDPPLETFFAILMGGGQLADPLLWIGTGVHELYELEDLEAELRVHGEELPRALVSTLHGDRDEGR
jgi:hypothetical protein